MEILEINGNKLYKFNVIGLIAVALNVRIKREKYFYCAEFVKYVWDCVSIFDWRVNT